MSELFSLFYMIILFSVCRWLLSLYFRVNSSSAWTEKFLLLRVILWFYGSLWKVLLQQKHLNFISQPVVLKHYLKIKILNSNLLWELNIILIQHNKFGSLVSRLFYQCGMNDEDRSSPGNSSSWCKLNILTTRLRQIPTCVSAAVVCEFFIVWWLSFHRHSSTDCPTPFCVLGHCQRRGKVWILALSACQERLYCTLVSPLLGKCCNA